MFCCYLKNGDNIFSTHLVVASGLNYEPLIINNENVPNVFNNADDITSFAKDQPALVIYNHEADAKFALEIAKKYKQVYVCTKTVNTAENIPTAVTKKLANAENLVMLPNTSIKKIVLDKNGVLQKIEFDNYSEISCSAIFIKTASKPAIDFIPKKLLSREEGYPMVKDNCESELAPKFFVAGNCLKKYTKAMEQKLVDSILKDF